MPCCDIPIIGCDMKSMNCFGRLQGRLMIDRLLCC